jgi:hypothetical protein
MKGPPLLLMHLMMLLLHALISSNTAPDAATAALQKRLLCLLADLPVGNIFSIAEFLCCT